MTIDDFLREVNQHSIITIESVVSIPGPAALDLLSKPQAVTMAEFLAHSDRHSEYKTFRYGHLLGPGLAPTKIDQWQDKHPDFRLPDDLKEFLTRVNGIELWADLADGSAYFGLLPLDQWSDAADSHFVYIFESSPVGALVISRAEDSAGYVVLDTTGPTFFWCDPIAGPAIIGSTVEDLLAYWWNNCRLDPE